MRESHTDFKRHPNGSKKSLRRTGWGLHMITTEAQSLEEAVDIIAAKISARKNALTKKNKPQTLPEIFGLAKAHAATKARWARQGPTPRRPHPLRDLADADKRAKVREFFEAGRWGMGIVGQRRLAKAFNVPVGQVVEWTSDLHAHP